MKDNGLNFEDKLVGFLYLALIFLFFIILAIIHRQYGIFSGKIDFD